MSKKVTMSDVFLTEAAPGQRPGQGRFVPPKPGEPSFSDLPPGHEFELDRPEPAHEPNLGGSTGLDRVRQAARQQVHGLGSKVPPTTPKRPPTPGRPGFGAPVGPPPKHPSASSPFSSPRSASSGNVREPLPGNVKPRPIPPREGRIPTMAELFSETWSDRLSGGNADAKDPSDFDPKSLAAGIKIEREHTKDEKLATEIAMDHLIEDPNYYDKLKKVENEEVVAEARKLTGVTAEYAGFVPSVEWENIHRKIEDAAEMIDREFVITSSDLTDAFENFMAALGVAMDRQAKMKRMKGGR